MDNSIIRPKVAQLSFQAFDRSLHPELFQSVASREYSREQFKIKIDITSAGHVISCWSSEQVWTEVAGLSMSPTLPERGRLFSLPISGSQKGDSLGRHSGTYKYQFGIERIQPKMLWLIQKQLADSDGNEGLIHRFNASGRIDIGGLSLLHVELRQNSVTIQAVHTFPDDLTLLKCESNFSFTAKS